MPRKKTPEPPRTFVPGVPISPGGPLLEWLASAGRRRLRIPVVIRFESEHRLGIGGAFIGTAGTPATPEAIHLQLEDSAMGISLLDRLRRRCPATSPTCAVWLEGAWGSPLDLGEPPAGPRRWPFSVFRLVEPAGEPSFDGAQVRILVEQEGGAAPSR